VSLRTPPVKQKSSLNCGKLHLTNGAVPLSPGSTSEFDNRSEGARRGDPAYWMRGVGHTLAWGTRLLAYDDRDQQTLLRSLREVPARIGGTTRWG
jgi:hypothetical protein